MKRFKIIIISSLLLSFNLYAQNYQGQISYDLEFSTYLGGRSYDDGLFMEIDSEGNIYLSGNTSSDDYPVTAGAYRTTMYNTQTTDLFFTKMKADGTDLIYSTFFGGTDYDGHDYFVDIDEAGVFYIFGVTASRNFPLTPDGYDRTYNGGVRDLFITAISSDGSEPVYSTYFGGNSGEWAAGFQRDTEGNFYLCGTTESSNFPVTSGAYDTLFGNGSQNLFLSKINPVEQRLEYSTFLPGNTFYHDDLIIDQNGCAIFCPYESTAGLPTTPGGISENFNGGETDIYIGKISADGSTLEYATYLGGNGKDEMSEMCFDNDGNLWLTGQTKSLNFPTTDSSYQFINPNRENIFIALIDPSNFRLLKCSIIPGVYGEPWGIAFEPENKLIAVAMETIYNDFPCSYNAVDSVNRGESDVYFSVYYCETLERVYATYIGGRDNDYVFNVRFDQQGGIILCGSTFSTDFPLRNAYQNRYKGGYKDGFVLKLKKIDLTNIDEDKKLSHSYGLEQNYPNPFNPATVINYQLSVSGNVQLTIYNLLGQKMKTLVDSFQNAGEHSVVWDATDNNDSPVSTGVYFYIIETNNRSLQKKMLLIR
jgi:hypothetical protein